MPWATRLLKEGTVSNQRVGQGRTEQGSFEQAACNRSPSVELHHREVATRRANAVNGRTYHVQTLLALGAGTRMCDRELRDAHDYLRRISRTN